MFDDSDQNHNDHMEDNRNIDTSLTTYDDDEIPSTSKIYPMDENENFEDIYDGEDENSLNMMNPISKPSSDDFNTALRLAFRNYCMIEWVMGKCTKGDTCRYDHSMKAQEYCQQASIHLQKRTISELKSPDLGFGVVKEINKS